MAKELEMIIENKEELIILMNEIEGGIKTIYINDIKAVRESRCLSQKELAQHIGATEHNIKKLESQLTLNNVSLEVLSDISEALDCSLQDLSYKYKWDLSLGYWNQRGQVAELICKVVSILRSTSLFSVQKYAYFCEEALTAYINDGIIPTLENNSLLIKSPLTITGLTTLLDSIGIKLKGSKNKKSWLKLLQSNEDWVYEVTPYDFIYSYKGDIQLFNTAVEKGYFKELASYIAEDKIIRENQLKVWDAHLKELNEKI